MKRVWVRRYANAIAHDEQDPVLSLVPEDETDRAILKAAIESRYPSEPLPMGGPDDGLWSLSNPMWKGEECWVHMTQHQKVFDAGTLFEMPYVKLRVLVLVGTARGYNVVWVSEDGKHSNDIGSPPGVVVENGVAKHP